MVSLDSRFVLDCAGGDRAAVARFSQLLGGPEPMYLSVVARAAVMTQSAGRDEAFRRRTDELLGVTQGLDIDPESVRCAAEIAEELARVGRRLDGVDLFVAAGARQHGHVVVTRNPDLASINGLACQSY